MALHTLGTAASTSLISMQFSAVMAAADLADMANGIVNDKVALNNGLAATASTNSNTSLTSVSNLNTRNGMFILGAGIPSGTTVVGGAGTATITMSRAATASASINVIFVPNIAQGFSTDGLLAVPNRGILKVQPDDYVAFDRLTGWPILVSREAVAATGSVWTFT